jgi:hypothetical protein
MNVAPNEKSNFSTTSTKYGCWKNLIKVLVLMRNKTIIKAQYKHQKYYALKITYLHRHLQYFK